MFTDEVLRDKPVAAYLLDNREALIDLARNGFNGVYGVNAGSTQGGVIPDFHSSLYLAQANINGANSTANAPASMLGNPSFSIEMILIPISFSSDTTYCGWGKTGVALQATGLWADSGGVLLCQYAGGNTATAAAAGTMTINKVYHVVYTKAAGAIAANSKFYLNGVDTGTVTGSSGTPNIQANTFGVGQWADCTGAGCRSGEARWQFCGFYDKVLDANTIKRHYRAALGQRPLISRHLRRS